MNAADIFSFAKIAIDTITPTLNQITAAIIIMFFGFIVGKVAGKVILRFLKDTHKAGKDILRWDFSKEISSAVTYIIYSIAIILGILALGVERIIVFTLLAICIIVAVLSFLFTAKDFIPNCRHGMRIRKLLKKGDLVKIDTIKGEILRSDLLTTTIKRKNGEKLLIPNAVFTTVAKKVE